MARNSESEPLNLGETFIEAFVILSVYLLGTNLWKNEIQPFYENTVLPFLMNLK